MVDIQNSHDAREVDLDQVGVRDLRYPITVLDQAQGRQNTVATISLSVNLPKHFKGTHMSRFIEILHAHQGEFTMTTLPKILNILKTRLEASSARIEAKFPYFLHRSAPISGQGALLDYECLFIANSSANGDFAFEMNVTAPVTTLCPCSKAISDYGAHNQRGYLTIQVVPKLDPLGNPKMIWLEEIIGVAESSASAPIYPLLKRVDERHVTMQAFDNPVFVEDIVRNVAVQLRKDPRIQSYIVECVNQESIHNHSAFARTSWQACSSALERPARELIEA